MNRASGRIRQGPLTPALSQRERETRPLRGERPLRSSQSPNSARRSLSRWERVRVRGLNIVRCMVSMRVQPQLEVRVIHEPLVATGHVATSREGVDGHVIQSD